MPYVHRNAYGEIDSLHKQVAKDAREFLPDGHADIQAFIGRAAPPEEFNRLDADFVRVIEDVIDTLISKNVLNITDLPSEAQAKLFARKSFRERVTKHSLRLFGEADDFGGGEVIKDTGFVEL